MREGRNLGLDIVRAIAVALVVICHGEFFLRGLVDTRFFGYVGVLSVEVFFVLSGFLVGRNMINTVVEKSTWTFLKKFYVNRFFRTIPLYYLLLLITAAIKKRSIPITCFFFWQNFDVSQLDFFPVSWSLSVEEWFYLVVPFVFVFVIKVLEQKISKQTIFWVVTLGICVFSFGLRVFTVLNNELIWDYGVRKQIFLRIDSIMMGVALAGCKVYAKNIYEKIAKSKISIVFALFGVIGLGTFYFNYLAVDNHFNNSKFWQIMFFAFLPFFCCFLVAYMEKNESLNVKMKNTMMGKLITELSVLSYALYLVHWNIFEQVSRYYKGWYIFGICVILSIVIAKILNVFIEEPMMNLRKRVTDKM